MKASLLQQLKFSWQTNFLILAVGFFAFGLGCGSSGVAPKGMVASTPAPRDTDVPGEPPVSSVPPVRILTFVDSKISSEWDSESGFLQLKFLKNDPERRFWVMPWMPSMDHGAENCFWNADAGACRIEKSQNGYRVGPIHFSMPGEWELQIILTETEDSESITKEKMIIPVEVTLEAFRRQKERK